MRILSETTEPTEAAKQIASLEPLGGSLTSEANRMETLARHLPVQEWPETPLRITAVDAESGSRVTFDRSSGVSLLDAVAASGALPGIYPLTTIDGRRYADGGVHSLYNADLAEGAEIVVIVTPQPLNDFLKAKLAAERRSLGDAKIELVIANSESLEAQGADPASVDHAGTAADAGFKQASHEADRLRAVWGS
jgi:NTE family protein